MFNRTQDIYNQQSTPLDLGYNAYYEEQQEEASLPSQRSPSSDEEIILASTCPKKRAGRKKFKETRHPVYRGVRKRNGNKWVCEVRTPTNKSRIWLGTYPTPEMAARAHDVAALALRGRLACLNFADSASILPLPATRNIGDIQRAAAEAAELFRPPESSEGSVPTVSQEGVANSEEVSTSGKNPEMEKNVTQDSGYVDEEAVFDMPLLLANMAEGLLLPPPHHLCPGCSSEELDSDCEVSLWSHTI
ncbi:basic helix-loop-helix protein [Dionaea muscipula]